MQSFRNLAQSLILFWLVVVLLFLLVGCGSVRPVPQFKAGDTVIAQHWTAHPEYNGETVRVTGGFEWRWVKELQGNGMRVYEVTTADGAKFAAQEFQLRRPVKP